MKLIFGSIHKLKCSSLGIINKWHLKQRKNFGDYSQQRRETFKDKKKMIIQFQSFPCSYHLPFQKAEALQLSSLLQVTRSDTLTQVLLWLTSIYKVPTMCCMLIVCKYKIIRALWAYHLHGLDKKILLKRNE